MVGVEAWRSAGMTYLRYLNVASQALRVVLKGELKTKAKARSDFQMRVGTFDNGRIKDRKDINPQAHL
ncbi:mitochondrial Complex V (CV) F1Fo ATP synthase F1 subunit epsilon (Atp15) [Andalucia godoyi]|uniref:Mitochondrial Complex V (CV) F1Fo ATP synthase F1 subunit epsilon (Atp15) n=1 Tax=Andalucia godoyi TaxID=505711 RepID=A0A8K0F0E8_ANDGO|nr:mitochondrial Complex V (CV) F1Fo ATP synthase F1 subunit epsilon (Atp15) [Andalucia godoyi]|eukprot:ANDGO_03024.mRNA.1 mitochondrial Complex V (CV) F1Fo ATP synthase F1 subunit epsilon (Atp15)